LVPAAEGFMLHVHSTGTPKGKMVSMTHPATVWFGKAGLIVAALR